MNDLPIHHRPFAPDDPVLLLARRALAGCGFPDTLAEIYARTAANAAEGAAEASKHREAWRGEGTAGSIAAAVEWAFLFHMSLRYATSIDVARVDLFKRSSESRWDDLLLVDVLIVDARLPVFKDSAGYAKSVLAHLVRDRTASKRITIVLPEERDRDG